MPLNHIYYQNDGWYFSGPTGKRFLANPTMFAVYSPSGNQWRKLMYFPDDWQNLNLLLSIYDIYCSDKGLVEEMLALGLRAHMAELHRRMGRKLARTSTGPYRDYRHYFSENDLLYNYKGLIMLDSGGFSFGQTSKVCRLLKSPFAFIRRFGKIMLAVADLEQKREEWNITRYTRLARIAQRLNLSAQLRLKPDIIITLDRIMDFELPLWLKTRRILFNLTCACTALEVYARQPGLKPLLFPVIHPLGPPLSTIGRSISQEEALRFYSATFAAQLRRLRRAEVSIGLEFDGLAVGSLVPVRNYKHLSLLAEAVQRAITQTGFSGRPLHAFGAADKKAVFLARYGFTSFDSNLHVVKARNRYIYDPLTSSYQKMILPPDCQCPVCRHHSPQELLENRPGVKEVATVLQSLHNFYTNHLSHLEQIKTNRLTK